MNIKPRYDEYRSGAMLFTPVKATIDDVKDFVLATRIGGTSNRSWHLTLDCRALVGKLMNHDELSKMMLYDSNDFLLIVDVEHPKLSERLLIGGNETRTIILYRNQKIEPYFKRIEDWLKKFLAGIVPAENLFNYGKRHQYGLMPNEIGQLSYVIVLNGKFGDRDCEYKFGQPFTENTWGLLD